MRDFEECKIKRKIDGYTDPDTGQWVEEGKKLIAEVLADIQPQTGQRREAELQTDYESDHIAFIRLRDIKVPEDAITILGLAEFEDTVPIHRRIQKIRGDIFKPGDILIDSIDRKFHVVFPSFWKDHFEIELEVDNDG